MRAHPFDSFLCPPPAVLLLGCSWWTKADAGPGSMDSTLSHSGLAPPSVSISMSTDTTSPDLPVHWITLLGQSFTSPGSNPIMAPDNPVIAGHAIGKHLYISETDEKRNKSVEVLVRISAPSPLN